MTDHTSTPALAPDDLARACAERMWADDPATRGLGMTMEDIGAGRATLAMQVGDAMVNGHGMCHGGFIFTLADSAFAFACNTYDRRTVAQKVEPAVDLLARLNGGGLGGGLGGI